jgi:hypothetical protein
VKVTVEEWIDWDKLLLAVGNNEEINPYLFNISQTKRQYNTPKNNQFKWSFETACILL